jgi:hypothetical protein
MLFLIRAIFWLSIVSYFLPWPEDKIALFLTNPTSKARRKIFWAAQLAWRKRRRNENVCACPQLVSRKLLG